MKKITLVIAATLLASTAIAAGTTTPKDSKSNGSPVGQSSSSYTGNGATISGNGNGIGPDQTTGPHSRPDAVNAAFPGSNNAGGSDNSHQGGNR
jgi:predicted small secreted protein